ESEDRYRALFEESHDAIYFTRSDGSFVEVNPAALRMFGYTKDELLRGRAQQLYVNAEDRRRFREEIERTGFVRNFRVRLRAKDGRELDCVLSSMVRHGAAGEVLGYQGIIHDVSARTESELKLRDYEHFTRTIVSSIHQGVIVYDQELRYQLFNRFMEEITGMRSEQVIGRRATDVFPHLVENGVDALLQRALAGETVQSPDVPYSIPATGRAGWTSALYSPHVSPEGEIIGVVAIVMDTTERKRAEDQLTYNAFHDALTGLPNRALFVDRLERLMRHTKRHTDYVFGVAFLDLDRFKLVNDSLGHLAGDELLIAIGRRLQECVRLGDTVARLGGDEFALLLDNVPDATDATAVAERILASLVEPFIADKHEVYITASIGIALSSTGYEIPEEILRDADTAMYRAKLEGRSRYEVFDRQMHERAVHVLQVDTDLRRAIDRNEFMLHYQPIIDLKRGRITGFEALIRWQHPQRGIVPPAEFIPVAEENGLIIPIGWWVLEEAARQVTAWNERFSPQQPLTMAVNLSPKQFLQGDLLDQLDAILDRTGIDPALLRLEITESVVIRNEQRVAATLDALRGRGIQLCIDDFGTGYSSLSYLHAFPIDTLKIDRSFVGQIGFTGNNAGLVETIVALSRNLGMAAVAEGVETAEQLSFLREVGPQYAQGYFFSAALAAGEIEEMLARDPVW
ncbi:MAG TPA: EAL domain-containing protein, partial [Longimicrobiales bacterium]